MTLPSTPPITSEMIRAEYGGPLPFRIRNYFRGGGIVPDTPGNSGVPTSGAISFYSFLGQGGGSPPVGPLTVTSTNASRFVFTPEPAPATRSVTANGSVLATGGTGSYSCTWAHMSGDAGIPTPAANSFSPSFTATVNKNSNRTAVKRCTVNDGVSTVFADMAVTLDYSTDV